jgi:hypothetical protein
MEDIQTIRQGVKLKTAAVCITYCYDLSIFYRTYLQSNVQYLMQTIMCTFYANLLCA